MNRLTKAIMLLLTFIIYLGTTALVKSAEYPKAGAACSTLVKQGVWTWYNDPRAVYYKGTKEKTYVGYFSTATDPGAAAVASYDHSNGTIQTFNLITNFGFDDHNNTTVFVRNDGYIMTFYSKHYGPDIRMRISANPEDISSFQAEKVVFTGSNTYPNVVQLSDEGPNGNRLFLFFRGPSTVNYDAGQPYFQTSDDGGNTWSSAIRYFDGISGGTFPAGLRPYVKYVSNGKDKIYMLIERDNRNNAPSKPTYIMYYYKEAFYRMNGTKIKTVNEVKTSPINIYDVDVVFDPSNFPEVPGTIVGTGWDIALDKDGYPVFVFDIYDRSTGQNHRYYYFRWDGTKFNHYFLVNSGGPMTEGGVELGFGGGIALDHENPDIVYLSTQIAGNFELQRWVTQDKGKTWKYWEITKNSGSNKNCRPIVPRGTPGGKIDVVWNCGLYASFATKPISMDVKLFTFDSLKMSDGITAARPNFERRAPKDEGINNIENGFMFNLIESSTAQLKLFDCKGRFVADLTNKLRLMKNGMNKITLRELKLARGSYIAKLFDGRKYHVQDFIINK